MRSASPLQVKFGYDLKFRGSRAANFPISLSQRANGEISVVFLKDNTYLFTFPRRALFHFQVTLPNNARRTYRCPQISYDTSKQTLARRTVPHKVYQTSGYNATPTHAPLPTVTSPPACYVSRHCTALYCGTSYEPHSRLLPRVANTASS